MLSLRRLLQCVQQCSRLSHPPSTPSCCVLLHLHTTIHAPQGLVLLQEYSGKASAALGAAWANIVAPFNVFDGWLLNGLFFAVVGLLTYSMLVLAPKQ